MRFFSFKITETNSLFCARCIFPTGHDGVFRLVCCPPPLGLVATQTPVSRSQTPCEELSFRSPVEVHSHWAWRWCIDEERVWDSSWQGSLRTLACLQLLLHGKECPHYPVISFCVSWRKESHMALEQHAVNKLRQIVACFWWYIPLTIRPKTLDESVCVVVCLFVCMSVCWNKANVRVLLSVLKRGV